MQSLITAVIIGLIGGVAIAAQAPMSSSISQNTGNLESIFIIHIGGAIAAGIPLLLMKGGDLRNIGTVPVYALFGGVLGLLVVGSINYAIPRVGVAPTLGLTIMGQLLAGLLLDHFGLLGLPVKSITPTQITGAVILLLGGWLVIK